VKVLVTGGSGLVGWNLAHTLIEQGHEVYTTSGGAGNKPLGKVFYRGVLGVNPSLFEEKFDVVFHQAANNDTRCMDEDQMTWVNASESAQLFLRTYGRGCRQFVFASSTAVYGKSPAPYIEEVTPVAPNTPYARSKRSMELWVQDLATPPVGTPATVVFLRYCNVYGCGEAHKGSRASMIYQLIQRRLAELPLRLFKDGTQKRDWVHVSDVVQANLLAMTAKKPGIYNVGSGVATSFLELAEMICGPNPPIELIDCPFPDEYQNYTCCDLTKIKAELGYEPKKSLKDGLDEYIEALMFA
jgi:ADP-L-glycero-D-manno-heptose 6-epimerase